MRDGQVSVHLPLNLNTEKAWVGQGNTGVAQDQGVITYVRRSHAGQVPSQEGAGVSCGPRVMRPAYKATNKRQGEDMRVA